VAAAQAPAPEAPPASDGAPPTESDPSHPTENPMKPPSPPEIVTLAEPGAPKAPPAAPPAAPPSGKPSLLVMEDNDETRLLLTRILRVHFDVDSAPSPEKCLELLGQKVYDVLVFDINLGSHMTGVDVLEAARKLPGYEQTFAMALTAYALPGDRERFLEAGFDRYVSKPFTKKTLLEGLESVMPAATV
jgi:CheY-like chemotaxis protein